MKKIFLLVFLFAALYSRAQFPVTVTSGNSSTLQKANGAFGAMLGYVFAGSYGDTTAANLSFIKNVPGILIRTGDDLWLRNSTATAWVNKGGGSLVDQDFAHTDLTASGNRVHNFDHYSLTIDSIGILVMRSDRVNSGNRYTTLGGKSLSTGYDIVSRYDANNISGVYVNNGNGTSSAYFDALGNGRYNAFEINPTAMTLYPHLGEIYIDTLTLSAGADQRMVTWDITNGRLGYQTISGGGSGAVSSGSQYRIAVYNTAGTTVSENAAITGDRALISNPNGLPTHSTTTATELGYVNGVTSPIQGQLDTKETAFLAANEEFTGSTSLSITISNTPLTTKEETYYLNGLVIQSSRISRVGTSVTFTGFVREATDIITVKYSYAAP